MATGRGGAARSEQSLHADWAGGHASKGVIRARAWVAARSEIEINAASSKTRVRISLTPHEASLAPPFPRGEH